MLYDLFLETKYKTYGKLNKTQREKQTQGGTMETKVCTRCHTDTPLTEYYTSSRAKDGYKSECKKCGRLISKNYRKNNPDKAKNAIYNCLYGITLEEVEKLIVKQNRRCLICSDEFIKTPHVDHCHTNGHVRGLLCAGCNTGLGLFKDNPSTLKMAAAYLEHDNEQFQESSES